MRPIQLVLVLTVPTSAAVEAQVHESPVAIADAIAAEVGSLAGWPPHWALVAVPDSARKSWRERLTASATAELEAEQLALAWVLLEILAQAESFDACDWGSIDVRLPPPCYGAWLRYYLGDESDADAVWEMAKGGRARYAHAGLREVDKSPVEPTWAGVDAQVFAGELTGAIQEADQVARAAARETIPWDAEHERVSVLLATGGPIGAYLGRGPHGFPIVRIDSAAARRWSRTDLTRVTAHEVWPGHHLLATLPQGSLHSILDNVVFSAFVEGWSTYAEVLATESADPLGSSAVERHLGRLALLAQVDVGLHARHWSRGAAKDTLLAAGGYSPRVAEEAVSTIVLNPGRQASYFVGYVTIRSIREMMESDRDGAGGLPEIHRRILRHGPLPLGVLRRLVFRE